MQTQLYFHSPFSEKSVLNAKNKALLLCFTLSEIFACVDMPSHECFLASSASKGKAYERSLNRLQEHSLLLFRAFANHKETVFAFKEVLFCLIYAMTRGFPFEWEHSLRQLFALLPPLIQDCKDDAYLVFFLLSHHLVIQKLSSPQHFLSLLLELYPEGLAKLQTFLCDAFHKNGLTRLIPQVTFLLQELTSTEASA